MNIKNGDKVKVIAGTHKNKEGIVEDLHISKTGATTITIRQANNDRLKTLAKNVQKI